MFKYFENAYNIRYDFLIETKSTIYMTVIAALVAGLLGLILGVILVLFKDGGLLENKKIYSILDKIVNISRSIPFIILIALLSSVTRFIVGTTIGSTAAIVPLVFACIPFYSRQVENALLEVDKGIIEAAKSMGYSKLQIILHVYLKEGLIGIVRVSQLTLISLLSLTTMAGAVGGGGLGNLAISQGYYRYRNDITIVATVIILVLVFLIQYMGNKIIEKISH
ncbi:ABC transporter permease [Streptobacillus felis]|uniref:ABC transporter permease n=1 Tax=Streptobacillus felis TaxID=1384509 RepID=A0A7Z0PFP7_9FUSO|nr:methionine ABC transporter permease [Streptobacillus felis]NYV28362.1 ABC transporter permease [Streptobacillus felis]